MDSRLQKLAQLFLKFPGIGERQARRFAFFILNQQQGYIQELTETIHTARSGAKQCPQCFRLHESASIRCAICSSPNRDQSRLLIVEKQADIEAVEQTSYNGLFFIFGGLIPIVEKKTMAKTRITELEARITTDVEAGVLKEVILAFPLTANGDHTEIYLRELLQKKFPTLSVTSLGRGLSMGSELEYIDPRTLEISIAKRE
ncbi:MAG TPA: toprim domain-containing protein [Candidatus Paceibacterota bacterium]|nr:toprim domain-containing protein [Candidatus Paceibacterota bacterium]